MKLLGGLVALMMAFIFFGLINVLVACLGQFLWNNGPAIAFNWPDLTLFQTWCLLMLVHFIKSKAEVEFK